MSDTSREEQSLEEINRELHEKGVSDGLPVIPPTEERVDKLLTGTDLPPDEELGRLGDREGQLTVHQLAINGVMAGCSPIHMPVLVAGARTLAAPGSNAIQSSVSTGSWAYFFLINGPVRQDIDIACGTGAFGPGPRANRSIGRALGLAYKNTALIHPGEKDMGVMGSPFKYSLVAGENEEASPWDPFHVEQGYCPEESTITLSAPNSFIQTMPNEMTAEGILDDLVLNTNIPRMVGRKGRSFETSVFYALSPYSAQDVGEDGLTKREVKEHIYRSAHLDKHKLSEDLASNTKGASGAPDGLPQPMVERQFDDSSLINVVVVGGSGRFNAAIGPSIGGPTTEKIELPGNWDELLEKYATSSEA